MLIELISFINENGTEIKTRKGTSREIIGVTVELTNPLARLSRTESRCVPFSCLGELCWYLSKKNETSSISYYIQEYEKFDENGIIHGGYGPRIFNSLGVYDQFENVYLLLKKHPTSRKGVIQIFECSDIANSHLDIPCTCSLQFLIRNNLLHMFTFMRSNDVYRGLPHDIFCFTMLQEIMANSLSVGLGSYKHFVGSMHLYKYDYNRADKFVKEGYQSKKYAMPRMPSNNLWPSIDFLLKSAHIIRSGGHPSGTDMINANIYWQDIIRLLEIFHCYKENNVQGMIGIKSKLHSDTYCYMVDKKIDSIKK